MLLKCAAREIARRLEDLRDILGPKGLWKLINEAYKNRNDAHFRIFWEEISNAARDAEIYWTSSETWTDLANCTLMPSVYERAHEKSLDAIGIATINSSMRPFKSSMSNIGVSNLTFSKLVNALKSWEAAAFDHQSGTEWPCLFETIRPIWRILEDFLERAFEEKPGSTQQVINRLKKELRDQIREMRNLRIAPHFNNRLAKLTDLYRLPDQVKLEEVSRYFPQLPLVSEEFRRFRWLFSLVPEFQFSNVLSELAERVQDEDTAISFLSSDKKRVRGFYDFLADFPRGEDADYSTVVASTPFLMGHGRFLAPQCAALPGGFDDPIGRFDTLDLNYFGDRSRNFLKEVLKVKTLTLETYIEEHLADILAGDISNEQYVALLDMLLSKKGLLEKESTRETLEALPLVRSKDGFLRPARECYSKTEVLAEILGNDDAFWVDEGVFAKSKKDLYLGFFRSLGMRDRPSLSHALDRIETIVESPPSDTTRAAISKIFDFLLEIYGDEKLAEKEEEFQDEISRMRHTDWLPAEKEGKLDTSSWYAPHELYQPFRAGGFSTQVSVLSVSGMRRRLSGDFLDFLEMPSEPDTSTLVDHLEECIERGLEPSRYTYQILNERLKNEDDQFSIARLKTRKCVYAPKKKEFIGTDRFFWSKPHLARYCFKAPEWMHQYKELFDFLGVAEEPSTETYVDVLVDIAGEFGGTASDLPGDISLVHDVCIKTLSTKLREEPAETSRHLERLRDHPFLLTLAGTLAFVDEVAVQDSDWLAEPFGGELDARLVRSLPETVPLIDWFKIRPLSSVTRLETVDLGEVIDDEEGTQLVRERSDLLGWLCSDLRTETRKRLEKTLHEIKLVRTDSLRVRSVFQLDDVRFSSPPRDDKVVFDADAARVYVLIDLEGSYWIPAFRAIFSTLLTGESTADIGKFALSADTVLSASSHEDASHKLRQAGYNAPEAEGFPTEELPEDEIGELDFGVKPDSDQADWDVVDDPILDETAGRTEKPASNVHIAEEVIKKATATGLAGAGTSGSERDDGSTGSLPSAKSASSLGSEPADKETRKSPRRARTEWMRSYVRPKKDGAGEGGKGSGPSPERISAIDEAAMKAVMDYEHNRDFLPERQPHFNPGFDILSRSKNADETRLIEVKGLDGEWTERGVKLSRTQISFARDHPDEAWLYVVEHALAPKQRQIHAIKNPFFRADEFWFDRVWREVADENGGNYKAQFVAGRRIQMEGFGVGTIIDIKKIGVMTQLKVEFKDWGTRSIAFNATTMELLED